MLWLVLADGFDFVLLCHTFRYCHMHTQLRRLVHGAQHSLSTHTRCFDMTLHWEEDVVDPLILPPTLVELCTRKKYYQSGGIRIS